MEITYDINEKFFEAWSPKMAYTLGYIYADGSLENSTYIRGKYLRFTSIYFSLVKMVMELIESKHMIVTIPPKTGKERTRY